MNNKCEENDLDAILETREKRMKVLRVSTCLNRKKHMEFYCTLASTVRKVKIETLLSIICYEKVRE